MSIAILLPYKENYTPSKAGAVSLFINDLNKNSFYKKDTQIYGSTNSKKYLSKNYVNLKINESVLKAQIFHT